MKKLFGTDGIRGTANRYPITPEMALKTGRAVARLLRASGGHARVVIGKDTRLSGYMLETALTSGLVSEGVDVLLVGPMPTPGVAHLTRSLNCSVGVMLTASHNPFEDNGLKFFGPDGFKLNDELEAKIESLLLGPDLATESSPEQIGKARRIDDSKGRYLEHVKHSLAGVSLEGLKVVLDCAHGAGYLIAPTIYEELGAEVIPLGVDPNGRNINAGVGALHPDHMAKVVRETKADIGIALDGDADRVIFCDHEGRVVSGDAMLGLCARSLKEEGKLRNDTVAVTVMSNLGLHASLQACGVKVVTTGVGDRLVLERMRQDNLAFGGENSGHLIFLDHATTGDGILSGLRVLSLLRARNAKLADLAAGFPEFPSRLVNLKVARKPALDTVPALQEAIARAEAAFAGKGRTLVRYSGTENKIRLLVECEDAKMADEQVENLRIAAVAALCD